MRIPLFLYLGAAAEAAPLVAAAVVRRPQRGARFWILAWCGLLISADALQLWLALHGMRNLWVGYVGTVAGALVLWALSFWQTGSTERLTLRVATILFLAVWVMLTVAVENTSSFSRAGNPMANVVCLVAAAYTLLARSSRSGGGLMGQDWFWASAGLALYFAVWSSVDLMRALLFGHDALLMVRLLEVGMVLNIVAFLAIARGVTCPAET
ncbi:MAG: hypothetical protein ABR998_13990 [Gemmatimonadales bacterium]